MSQESFKPEISQEEIRGKLEQTLASLQSEIQDKVSEYKKSIKEGNFDIEDGEKKKESAQKKISDLLEKAEKLKAKLDSGETLELDNNISFPEGMGQKIEVEIGGKDKGELIKELEENNVLISGYAKSMMDSPDFTTSKSKERLDLVRISVKDLGFPKDATTFDIYKKAQELGLELCPAEVGPQLRLQYLDQPNVDSFYIGMKPISDSNGYLDVFNVLRDDLGEPLLFTSSAELSDEWGGSHQFVFRLPRK